MALALLTVRTVLLLAVWLLLWACIVFIYPLGQFLLFVLPFIVFVVFLVPVAGLVIIHRRFLELPTLRMLSWVATALVCVAFLGQVMLIVQIFVVPEIASSAPWLFRAISQSSAFWLALLLGVVAGLRWPERSPVPVLAPEANRKLIIAVNVAAITLTAGLGGFLIDLGDSWPYWLPWSDNWQSAVLVFRNLWGFGALVSNILVVSLLMVFFTQRPGFTPQLLRVIIGGLSGTIALMVLRTVVGEVEIVFQFLVLSDRLSITTMVQLINIFPIGGAVVGWLGVTLGVWAGLRWPERLLLTAPTSGGTQRVRVAKNVVAIAVCSLLALILYWASRLGWLFFLGAGYGPSGARDRVSILTST